MVDQLQHLNVFKRIKRSLWAFNVDLKSANDELETENATKEDEDSYNNEGVYSLLKSANVELETENATAEDEESYDNKELAYLSGWIRDFGNFMKFGTLVEKIKETAQVEYGEHSDLWIYEEWFFKLLNDCAFMAYYTDSSNEEAIALIDALAEETGHSVKDTLREILKEGLATSL